VDTFLQDLRFAWRMLFRSRAFTIIALLSLAIGIGANTTIFSVIYSVLLRPLPAPHPEQLYSVYTRFSDGTKESASLPDYTDWNSQNSAFANMAAFTRTSINLGSNGEPQRLIGGRVTANLFSVLQLQPVVGRAFTPEEDRPNGPHVAILSYKLWMNRFGGNRDIVGQNITLNAVSYQVVGVAPAAVSEMFAGDIWLPLALDPAKTGRRSDFLRVVGRLQPGVSGAQAQSQLDSIANRLAKQFPNSNDGIGIVTLPLHEDMVSAIRPTLLSLWGAVGFVLLIVSANVANLLLARATVREKEIAVRAALGARRMRLFRQLLTESSLLAVIGGGLGIVIAAWGSKFLDLIVRRQLGLNAPVVLDTPVLLFAGLVSIGTGLVFGILPALHVAGVNLHESLKLGGRTQAAGRQNLRRALVVSEIALSLLLLVGAGLMLRTMSRLLRVDPGFTTDNMLSFRLTLPSAKYKEPQQVQFFASLIERLRALPQVQSAAAVSDLYLTPAGAILTWNIDGLPTPNITTGGGADAQVRIATPQIFETYRIELLRGRVFTDSDTSTSPNVAIINRRFADRFYPGQDLLGKRISYNNQDGKPVWREIVGLIGNVHQEALDADTYPEIIVPFAQYPTPTMSVLVRTKVDPISLIDTARAEVRALDATVPLYAVRSMREVLSESVAARKLQSYLLGGFAGIALLLAAIGIYGVMAQAVQMRMSEFGIRMALGARPRDILSLAVNYGLRLTLIGLGIGLTLSLILAQTLSRFLYGIGARDPWTLAAVTLLLASVALLACYIPSRRAMSVDPAIALHNE
jgi:putative ABC transport system permease protein